MAAASVRESTVPVWEVTASADAWMTIYYCVQPPFDDRVFRAVVGTRCRSDAVTVAFDSKTTADVFAKIIRDPGLYGGIIGHDIASVPADTLDGLVR